MRTKAIACTLAIFAGCTAQPTRPMVFIKAPPGVPLTNVCDVSVFGDFRPGITFGEAEKLYGSPESTLYERDHVTEHRFYATPTTRVSVAREERHGSMGSEGGFWWTVFAYPTDGHFPIESIFTSNIVSQIRAPSTPYILQVRGSDLHQETAWCDVTASGITRIRWIGRQSKSRMNESN